MIQSINGFSETWSRWIYASSWQLMLLIIIVAILVALLRKVSPQLRYGLWLLVLIKVFLPASLWLPIGIGHWGLSGINNIEAPYEFVFGNASVEGLPDELAVAMGGSADKNHARLTNSTRLMFLWIVGAGVFWVVVILRYLQLARSIRGSPTVDEGPLRVALERSAIALGMRHSPDLRLTESLTSPFLMGVIHPCIVLPRQFVNKATDSDLSTVLTHELVHLKRWDTCIGWLQVIAQGLFWFHPFFWWASRELRHHREEACDETVLYDGKINPESYGETMMKVLTSAKASSLTEGSLVGVFERGAKIQTRLEHIMNFKPTKSRFPLASNVAVAIAALLLLPMSPDHRELGAQDVKPASQQKQTRYPQIVKTVPEIGADDVKLDLKKLSVTFDRDMDKGMSWTGDPKLFPKTNKQRPPKWIDNRTCVLPIQLAKGKFYRVGFNSQSHQNFRATDGMPLPPTALYFVTEGATPEIAAKVKTPEVVKMVPANGATDVDAKTTKTLTVTFNVPMSPDMSWTGSGAEYPQVPKGKSPSWSKDRMTCTLPVRLKSDHKYRLGLNSLSFNNFQSESGIPLKPVEYRFQTK